MLSFEALSFETLSFGMYNRQKISWFIDRFLNFSLTVVFSVMA